MPIRINLKELFPADSQEITIDKVNFNFNKLLELGVGEPGPTGLSGSQGSAGPAGGTGSQGIRGVTWFVDSGDPTISTGLLDGDLYLDSDTLAVWQWDSTTNTWTKLFDITQIIQNYLNASPSPFIRGFGAGSPDDQRFILFNKRNGDPADDEPGSADSTNDVLFLSNYDESLLVPNPPVIVGSPNTKDFYNALLSISVDQRNTGVTFTRSHIELGAAYLEGGNPILSSLDENFKVRYDRLSGVSVHPYLDPTKNHYNQLTFSLDVLDSGNSVDRIFSSVFAFVGPKYMLTDPTNTFSMLYIGSRYGLDEVSPLSVSEGTLADGILFFTEGVAGNIGTAIKYAVPEIPDGTNTGYLNNTSATQSYFMLDSVGLANAIFLNDKIYQNGGSFIQLGTTAARIIDFKSQSISTPVASLGNIGIASRGDLIYLFGADSNLDGSTAGKKAYFSKLSATNPNFIQTAANISFPLTSVPVINEYATAGATQPAFAGISDIAISGELMYTVNNQSTDLTTPSPRTQFQILKLDEVTANTEEQAYPSQLGKIENSASLDCAHRVELAGRYAIVATNALPHGATINKLGGTSLGAYDGRITAIDLACTNQPTVVASQVTNKFTLGSKSAFMDLAVVDNYAYTLTWEQKLDPTTATVRVQIDAFDISKTNNGSPSITWKRRSNTTYINSSTVNSTLYGNLSKTGAIDATSKYIYSAYSVYGSSVYSLVFKIHDRLTNTIGLPPTLSQVSTLTLTTSSQIKNVVDLKHVGSSVYILGNTAANEGYVYKVDVSNAAVPFKVWEKKIEFTALSKAAGRLLVVGKHIYAATHDTGGGANGYGGLVAIDFDGFYTGGAHIESLRADELITTGDANIGQHLTVNSDANISNDANIGGALGVGSNAKVCGDVNIGGNLVTAGDITGQTINANVQFVGNGTIPIGGVIMWSGTLATVPIGWTLCDGTAVSSLPLSLAQKTTLTTVMGNSNVPDLRERFVVGAASTDNPTVIGSPYGPRATGGLNSVSLVRANIPPHKHQYGWFGIEDGVWGSGSGPASRQWPNSLAGYPTSSDGSPFPRGARIQSPLASNSLKMSSDADTWAFTSNTIDGTNNVGDQMEIASPSGVVTPVENRPPFYALAFIMRIV